jgi:hypothetical protein
MFRVSFTSHTKWFIFTSRRAIKIAIVLEHVTDDNLMIAEITIVPQVGHAHAHQLPFIMCAVNCGNILFVRMPLKKVLIS